MEPGCRGQLVLVIPFAGSVVLIPAEPCEAGVGLGAVGACTSQGVPGARGAQGLGQSWQATGARDTAGGSAGPPLHTARASILQSRAGG